MVSRVSLGPGFKAVFQRCHGGAVQPFRWLSTTGHPCPAFPRPRSEQEWLWLHRAVSAGAGTVPKGTIGVSWRSSTSGHSGAQPLLSCSDIHLQPLCCFSRQCTEQWDAAGNGNASRLCSLLKNIFLLGLLKVIFYVFVFKTLARILLLLVFSVCIKVSLFIL